MGKAYLEHSAISVKDINWHIRFFEEIFNMKVRQYRGEKENPAQVWLYGGIQLNAAPDCDGADGRFSHFGIMADDQQAVVEAAYRYGGVTEMPQGHNWFRLPDGTAIEVLQASEGAVDEALAVKPWIE